MLVMLAIIIALAVLAPVFGADTRDGLSWTPDHFWLPRRSNGTPKGKVRSPGSRGRADGDRAAEGARRTIPAAG
ncbi:hypothetical protein GCM10009727_17980 [Actinomadura napierensis]|uniref:Uncharacterized protein n=1 Tax=Actinomadura napierensis TaxID=267854 RepID=A0ABP5K9T6_9ACTN